MCRHLAYLGPPCPLRELLTDPPRSLYRQSWEPRLQRYGTVNADGFGVGWYADGDPVPARYRRAVPIWGDPSLADLARVVRSGAVLAAVRSATDGTAQGEASAAPFAAGRWLFSHNGALPGWPGAFGAVAATLSPEELLAVEARCDSALVWALVLRRLRDGTAPGGALASTVAALGTGRLNLLLTDGSVIAATTWGDTLFHLLDPGGGSVVVASEPYDDDPRWEAVPDRSLLLATPAEIVITPLAVPADPDRASLTTTGPVTAPGRPPAPGPPAPASPGDPAPSGGLASSGGPVPGAAPEEGPRAPVSPVSPAPSDSPMVPTSGAAPAAPSPAPAPAPAPAPDTAAPDTAAPARERTTSL